MRFFRSRHEALDVKLLRLARGNYDLLHEAISASADPRTDTADLKDVVDYIIAKRDVARESAPWPKVP